MAVVTVTLRFIMCLLLALLLFRTAWGKTNANILEDEEDFFSTEKTIVVDSVPDGSVVTKTEIGGRKMIQNKVMMKRVLGIKGSGAAQKVSSENQLVAGKSGNKGNSNNNEAAAGFVAFNADYHAPRHHPPKNN